MANIKQNKAVARCIVAAGTLLACLGIWTSVVNQTGASQSVNTAPLEAATGLYINPNLSSPAIVELPQGVQTGLISPAPVAANQTVPVQPAQPAAIPATPAPVTTAPPAAAPTQAPPAVTAAPAPKPVLPPPVTTAPRLRTRGS